jgi:tetratricopeptide (TPR) repeat protein
MKLINMKKSLFLPVFIFFMINQLLSQNVIKNSGIDLMLVRGDYEKAIDTCKLILASDSLNPDIYYKMAIAYQNTLDEEQSLNCYYKASRLKPESRVYNFSLAKAYYTQGKFNLAEPLLINLNSLDSTKWLYAYYLSSIYMQSEKYDDALNIYNRFLSKDSTNSVYIDKAAFAYLKSGYYYDAIYLYNKSLSINNKNLSAIKNLSFLYASTMNADTAIQILTRGIEIDSTDKDLYIRRAQINYSKNYTKRAMDDYLVLLASGDSTKLYLKRTGIGYSYNLQPKEAIRYLLLAYKADSADYETSSFLGQCYYKIKDMKNSIYYYKKVQNILRPIYSQVGLTHYLCADSQRDNGSYKDAIDSYLRAYAINSDPNINMIIANIYDEKLNNKERAITYYQRFLNTQKSSKMKFPQAYIEKIEKRLEYLKNRPPK